MVRPGAFYHLRHAFNSGNALFNDPMITTLYAPPQPPFCTGETEVVCVPPKRREIGHGAPGRRALRPLFLLASLMLSVWFLRLWSQWLFFHKLLPGSFGFDGCWRTYQASVSGVAMGLIQEEGKTVV